MKIRTAAPLLLALIVCAAGFGGSGDDAAAKKKASYCAAQAKNQNAKSVAKVKSQKFFVYTDKRKTAYLYCSESPKKSGLISASEGIKTTSHLRAVKGNCAVWRLTTKQAVAFSSGATWLKIVPYVTLRKGATSTIQRRLALKTDSFKFENIALSKNCVYVAAYTINGTAQLAIDGAGKNASFNSYTTLDVPGATPAELRAVKVVSSGGSGARVTWKQAGVPKSFDFTGK